MAAGAVGGPQLSRYVTVAEKSTKLWRYPNDFSRIVGYPARRTETAGGAHIVTTTDSEGVS